MYYIAVNKTRKIKNPNVYFVIFLFPFSCLFVSGAAEMGCGLNKLEKHDEKRPGNIYSTLKRPQVETKIDVSYEYRFLDFTTLNDGKDAVLSCRFFFCYSNWQVNCWIMGWE